MAATDGSPSTLATTDELFDRRLEELLQLESDLRPLRDQWDRYWAAWELEPPADRDNPYISRFQAPYPFSHVETILPRIVGADPTITYTAIDREEDDPPAQMLSAVVNWQMQQMGFEHEIRNFIRQGLITGYTVAKVGWIREVEVQNRAVERRAYDEHTLEEYTVRRDEDVEIVTRNQAFLETVDIYDFLWPVKSSSLDKAPAVWQRRWVTLEYMQEMQRKGVYKNVEDIRPGETGDRQQALEERFQAQGLTTTSLGFDPSKAEVELWERWEDDNLYAIANRDVEVRDNPNPFHHGRKPFIDWAPVERPFSMHGVGIPRMIWDQWQDISALKRQRRDGISLNLNPMWKATEGFDQSSILMTPGGVTEVPDTDDIQPMALPVIDVAASYQEEQQAKADMEQVTGANDFLSGEPLPGRVTATGVATVAEQATARVNEMIQVFSERSMKRFGAQVGRLCTQFLDEAVAVPLWKYPDAQRAWQTLKGESAPRIARVGQGDIKTAGQVMPIPEVGVDKTIADQQARSDATQLMQAITPVLASPVPVVDPKALLDVVMKKFGVNQYDREKILSPQNAAPATNAPSDGGDTRPTGNVVGAPGVAGPAGSPGMAQG